MIRILSKATIAACLLLASTGGSSLDTLAVHAAGTKSFSDTSGHWANAAIEKAIQKGYIDGYEDATFRPENHVSRAEFIKMVAAAISKKVEAVEGTAWYLSYITALKEEGVLAKDYYLGDMNLSMERAEMAMIATKAVNKELSGNFVDATKLGLIHGLSSGELAPNGTTTRAQAVTVIERILDKKSGKDLPVDKYAVSKAEIAATGSNVGSMLGLKPKAIGQTWEADTGVTITFNELVISDPLDAEDPYLPYVASAKWDKMMNKNTDVVVLAKFTVKIEDSAEDSGTVYAYQHLTLYNGSGLLLLDKGGLPRALGYHAPGAYSGYVAYSIEKNLAKTGLTFQVSGNKVKVAGK